MNSDPALDTGSDGDARDRLLDAALTLIRAKGYAATSVGALCRRAGVTKGAFFHHFRSKDELAVAAAERWASSTAKFFENAPYNRLRDPLERILAYLEFRKSLIRGEPRDYSCLAGTLVQETYESSSDIREACGRCISEHAAVIEKDLAAAMANRKVDGQFTASGIALHIQAVLQGAIILAKARDDSALAIESIDHLRRYIECLFTHEGSANAIPAQLAP